MSRRYRFSIVIAAGLAALTIGLSTASASGPVAQNAAMHRCRVGNEKGLGYTYLTGLWVQRTSCKTGKYLARHHGRVRGWRCSRRSTDRYPNPVVFDGKVTCRSGGRRVDWNFTQDK